MGDGGTLCMDLRGPPSLSLVRHVRIGLHMDLGHFSLSPCVAQMRRRLWNHFVVLDSQLLNAEGTKGADSGMHFLFHVHPAKNTNDNQWTPDQDGLTGMTFVLLLNYLFDATPSLQRKACQIRDDEIKRIVDDLEAFLEASLYQPPHRTLTNGATDNVVFQGSDGPYAPVPQLQSLQPGQRDQLAQGER